MILHEFYTCLMTKQCPKCGAQMVLGAPHVPYPCRQWECPRCGKIVVETLG